MRGRLLGTFFMAIWVAGAQIPSIPRGTRITFDSLTRLSTKQWLTDSLSIKGWGDSLKTKIASKTALSIGKLNHKIDSLQKLQLPTDKLQNRLDSINQKKNQLLSEVNGKQQTLLSGTKQKLNDWQGKIKTKLGVNMQDVNSAATDVNGKPIGDLNLPTNNLNLPSTQLNLKDLDLPAHELGLSQADLKIPSLSAMDFQNLDLPKDLSDLNQSLPFDKVDGLQEWQGKISGITDNISSLKEIKTNPDQLIEKAATNIGEIDAAKKVLNNNALEQSEYGALVKNINDEEAMKKMVTNEVKKEAINHFAGKEQVLQAAMEQVAKYKKYHASVNSLSEIKKLKVNPLKGKPLIERIVPGFGLQIHVKNYVNLDFNPFVGYRITEKISAGLGWNQRWAMDWSTKNFIHEGRVYGPRVFGEYKLKKGFAIRLEGEAMNTYIPPYNLAPGEGKRKWIYTAMTGLKKEYRFIGKVKAYTIVQFDVVKLFVPNHQSVYGNVVSGRLGFEFPMKKKPKQMTRPANKSNP